MVDMYYQGLMMFECLVFFYCEFFYLGYFKCGDFVLFVYDLDLEMFDFVDVEVWWQNKIWDCFEWLCKEDFVYYILDSFFGFYWLIIWYWDIVVVDSDYKWFLLDFL